MKIRNAIKGFKQSVYNHMLTILISISAILLIFHYCGAFSERSTLDEIVKNAGFAILSSGTFAGILKSIQYSGIFKEELRGIMTDYKVLENRNDLPDLWKKISHVIYKEKFPEISEHIDRRILESYFPTSSKYYYKDYYVTIHIERITSDLVLEYTQTCKYEIVKDESENSPKVEFETLLTNFEEDKKLENTPLFFKLNDKKANLEQTEIIDGKNKKVKYSFHLIGPGPFKVHHSFRRKQSLDGENYKIFRTAHFTKNMNVSINHPKDVTVSFFNIGMVNNFEEIHSEIPNNISRIHSNDIILPYQGFGITFNKNINKE